MTGFSGRSGRLRHHGGQLCAIEALPAAATDKRFFFVAFYSGNLEGPFTAGASQLQPGAYVLLIILAHIFIVPLC